MRRMILTSLVLLPVLAQAHASTPTETQPSTSSAMLNAAAVSAPTHAMIHQVIQTKMTNNFVDAALHNAGSLTFAMFGSVPTEASAPRLTHAVEVDLSDKELSEVPSVTSVVVHAMVDEYGNPRNVSVVKSAGAALDRKAIAAVNQYHFLPATIDNHAVESAVTITIKIQKP